MSVEVSKNKEGLLAESNFRAFEDRIILLECFENRTTDVVIWKELKGSFIILYILTALVTKKKPKVWKKKIILLKKTLFLK